MMTKKSKPNKYPFSGDVPDFRVFVGGTGCGKTTAALSAAEASGRDLVVLSPKAEIDGLAGRVGGVLVDGAVGLVRALQAPLDRPIVLCTSYHSGALDFEVAAAAVRRYARAMAEAGTPRRVLLLVDEMHSAMTGKREAVRSVLILANAGRAEGVAMWGISPRPMHIPTDVRGALSRLWVGRLALPADVRDAASMLGVPVDRVAGLRGYDSLELDALAGGVFFNKGGEDGNGKTKGSASKIQCGGKKMEVGGQARKAG